MVLEQEVGHLGVAIVTGHMERSVAHLRGGGGRDTKSGVCEKENNNKKNKGNIVTGVAFKAARTHE